jgi:hypothetical protein
MSEISTLVIVFVAMGMGLLITILGMRHSEREHIRKLQAKGALGDSQAMRAEFEALKARVEVLERLVTDEDRKLASEIGRLHSANGTSAQT